jgi:hypothetical protein
MLFHIDTTFFQYQSHDATHFVPTLSRITTLWHILQQQQLLWKYTAVVYDRLSSVCCILRQRNGLWFNLLWIFQLIRYREGTYWKEVLRELTEKMWCSCKALVLCCNIPGLNSGLVPDRPTCFVLYLAASDKGYGKTLRQPNTTFRH